eukprot:363024-Chlamydomonas_euryale.AAC.1
MTKAGHGMDWLVGRRRPLLPGVVARAWWLSRLQRSRLTAVMGTERIHCRTKPCVWGEECVFRGGHVAGHDA